MTRMTEHAYAKPLALVEKDPGIESEDEETGMHLNQQLFSSVDIDLHIMGVPYEPIYQSHTSIIEHM